MALKDLLLRSACLALCFYESAFAYQQTVTLPKTAVKVAFSPDDGITNMVIEEIDKATKSIDVAAYSFTSAIIAEHLIQAHQKGIRVRVVLDESQKYQRKSVAAALSESGLEPRFNPHYKIQHNKYMIIDEKHVECGSFNYTKSAESSNAENAIIVMNAPDFAKVYVTNFNKLWDECLHAKRIKKGGRKKPPLYKLTRKLAAIAK